METETPYYYHLLAHVSVVVGCFVYSKGMYKELSARIVLALISPIVFAILGPLLALGIQIPFGLILRGLSMVGVDISVIHMGHYLGIMLVAASLMCISTLRYYSLKTRKSGKLDKGIIRE